MSGIKQYIYGALVVIVIFLIAAVCVLYNHSKKLKEQYFRAQNNYQALVVENNSLSQANRTYLLSVKELNNSNDSLMQEINSVRKQLKVKDREIAHLSYLASVAQIKDTITLSDTIFVKDVQIDTTIIDEWYLATVNLRYPSTVGLSVTVPSEKIIVASYQKELLNPSKCVFINLFKRKDKILEVEVVEKNPNIINGTQKFIKVVK